MSTKAFVIVAASVLVLIALAVYLHRPAAAPMRRAMSATLHGGH
jgi:hypothetical protein